MNEHILHYHMSMTIQFPFHHLFVPAVADVAVQMQKRCLLKPIPITEKHKIQKRSSQRQTDIVGFYVTCGSEIILDFVKFRQFPG